MERAVAGSWTELCSSDEGETPNEQPDGTAAALFGSSHFAKRFAPIRDLIPGMPGTLPADSNG
jgi:hypothetical protein